jgi:hypothetical protein
MNMKHVLLAVVAVALVGLSAPPAPAFFFWYLDTHHHGQNIVILEWPGYTVYPPGTVFQQQLVQGAHAHWYQQQVPTVVPRLTYKVETKKVTNYDYVAKEVDEKQTAVSYLPTARLVEREIVTTVKVPVHLNDPNGHPIVTHRIETRTHRVKYPVYEYRIVTKDYAVRVTKMVPVEKVVEYKQIMPVVVYDQKMTTEWHYMMVPYQQMATVPTFDPYHAPHLFWP